MRGNARLVTSIGLAAATIAWTRPTLPTAARRVTAPREELDYMIFVVNGATRVVNAEDELAVNWGDTVEVKDAALRDPAQSPKSVEVVGMKRGSKRRADGRGASFTTEQLKPKSSEGGKGELYAVLATTKSRLHGAVYLRLLPPVLRYAELSVNGVTRVLRDGEPLAVRASDQVKVEKVVTNLESNAGVLFEIGGASPPTDAARGYAEYTVSFRRGGAVFARIPLRVLD
jgi:hypothetical protein